MNLYLTMHPGYTKVPKNLTVVLQSSNFHDDGCIWFQDKQNQKKFYLKYYIQRVLTIFEDQNWVELYRNLIKKVTKIGEKLYQNC